MTLIKVCTKYAVEVFKLMAIDQVLSCSSPISVDVPVQDTNKVPSQGVSKVAHVGFKTPEILSKMKDNHRRRSNGNRHSMKHMILSLSMGISVSNMTG